MLSACIVVLISKTIIICNILIHFINESVKPFLGGKKKHVKNIRKLNTEKKPNHSIF